MAKVLIVDDEPGLTITLGRFLKNDGHDVATAGTAMEALEIVAQTSFDVVVSDIIMPNIDGMQLLDTLNEHFPRTKVVLITGRPSIDSAAEAVRRRAFDYMAKPIDKNAICQVVRNAARTKELEEKNYQYQLQLEEMVLERSRESRDYSRRLLHIVKHIPDLPGARSIEELGQKILSLFTENIGVEGGSLYWKESDELKRICCHNDSHQPPSIPLPFSANSVLEKVFTTGEPFMTLDICEETGIEPSGWSGYQDRSCLVFPLKSVKNDINGAISLHNKPEQPFSEQDLELGQIIAGLASEAILNFMLTRHLEKSEKRYREISDRALTGIFIHKDEKLVYANPRMAQILGYDPKEIPEMEGESISRFLHPDDREEILQIIAERQEGRRPPEHYEIPLVNRQGERIWVDMLITTVEHQGTREILGHLVDITPRKTSEEALIRSEETYRVITENLNDMIWSYNLDERRFEFVSGPSIRLLGYTHAEVLSLSFEDLLAKESLDDLRKGVQKMKVEGPGGEGIRLDLEHCGKNGKRIWMEIASAPITDSEGRVRFLTGVSRPIGERMMQKMERERLIADIQRKYMELQALIDNASQNLRASLDEIRSRRQVFEIAWKSVATQKEPAFHGNEWAHVPESLQAMESATEQMDSLTRSLLESVAGTFSGDTKDLDK